MSNPEAITPDREAITYYDPTEYREADQVPLRLDLIRRVFSFTRPYAAKRNWLFALTFARGLQLPALAWMIGRTINGRNCRRRGRARRRTFRGHPVRSLIPYIL